eukprot:4635793-Prymnesium_polylepis.1
MRPGFVDLAAVATAHAEHAVAHAHPERKVGCGGGSEHAAHRAARPHDPPQHATARCIADRHANAAAGAARRVGGA